MKNPKTLAVVQMQENGDITLPQKIIEELKLQENDILFFKTNKDSIEVAPGRQLAIRTDLYRMLEEMAQQENITIPQLIEEGCKKLIQQKQKN